jgi:hypothetical protein
VAGSISSFTQPGNVPGATAAGTAIATLSHTVLTQKGQYRINVYPTIGAGVGANDANNISLVVGGSTVVLPVAAVSMGYGPYSFIASLDGNTDVVAKVGANASVGAYSVLLTAEYLGPMGNWR